MTASAQTAEAPPLSVECQLAKWPGYEDLHRQCCQTKDVPLPYSTGVLLARRCGCTCHEEAARVVMQILALVAYVVAVTAPVLALVLARTPA